MLLFGPGGGHLVLQAGRAAVIGALINTSSGFIPTAAVYVISCPVFGVFPELFPVYAASRSSASRFVAMGLVGDCAAEPGGWVHHMFPSGCRAQVEVICSWSPTYA